MRTVIVTALGAPAPALAWTETAARARRARAQVVAVRAPPSPDADARVLIAETCRDLRRLGDDLCGQATVDVVIARGELVTEIVRAAIGDGADLIVVGDDLWPGQRLAPAIGRLVAGARCRVLLVRECPPTGVVVGGVDRKASSRPVIEALADETAARPEASGFIVECVEAGDLASRPASPRGEPSRHAVRALDAVTDDAAAAELVAAAADLGAELLVVGAGGPRGSDPTTLGPVASHSVERAACSVLVVPAATAIEPWSRRRSARPEA